MLMYELRRDPWTELPFPSLHSLLSRPSPCPLQDPIVDQALLIMKMYGINALPTTIIIGFSSALN